MSNLDTIRKIFNDLLLEWEANEMCIWQDRSIDMDADFQNILERKEDYVKRMDDAIKPFITKS